MEAVRAWRIPKASTETIVREEHHHSTETIPPEILERFSAIERQFVDQERALQIVVQAADGLLQRLQTIEVALAALAEEAARRMTEAG